MAMYNILVVRMTCPHCSNVSNMEAEFRFGFLNLDQYQLGDKLRWDDHGGGLRHPRQLPDGGNYSGDAYVECSICHRDFWLVVNVENSIIKSVCIDPTRKGFLIDYSSRVAR